MFPAKIPVGQIAVVLGIVVAWTWGATQWTAAALGYQQRLGEPWFLIVGRRWRHRGRAVCGNSSKNTYLASSATGQAIIYPNEAAGSVNERDFTGGISDENLWFLQSGNDLKIDLVGTNTSVTVSGWFSGSSNQLQEITAGGLKIVSQVSQLVQAMATYSANNTGFDPTSSSIQTVPNNTALHNSVAATWHA